MKVGETYTYTGPSSTLMPTHGASVEIEAYHEGSSVANIITEEGKHYMVYAEFLKKPENLVPLIQPVMQTSVKPKLPLPKNIPKDQLDDMISNIYKMVETPQKFASLQRHIIETMKYPITRLELLGLLKYHGTESGITVEKTTWQYIVKRTDETAKKEVETKKEVMKDESYPPLEQCQNVWTKISSFMKENFYGLDDLITLEMITILTGGEMTIVGPIGTGRSDTVKKLCMICGLSVKEIKDEGKATEADVVISYGNFERNSNNKSVFYIAENVAHPTRITFKIKGIEDESMIKKLILGISNGIKKEEPQQFLTKKMIQASLHWIGKTTVSEDIAERLSSLFVALSKLGKSINGTMIVEITKALKTLAFLRDRKAVNTLDIKSITLLLPEKDREQVETITNILLDGADIPENWEEDVRNYLKSKV